MGAGQTSMGVTFYFDPGCPWTWMTSRWLVAAAQERSLDVRWRTFSLALLNKDRPLPPFLDTPEMRAKTGLAARALRVVDAAVTQGDNEAAGRFYTEFGTRFHESGQPPSDEMLDAAVEAATSATSSARPTTPSSTPPPPSRWPRRSGWPGRTSVPRCCTRTEPSEGPSGRSCRPHRPARRPVASGTPWPAWWRSARSTSSSEAAPTRLSFVRANGGRPPQSLNG